MKFVKDQIKELMKDDKDRTAFQISKELGKSYANVHRYVKELYYQGVLVEHNRTKELPVKIYYKLNGGGVKYE